MREVRKEVDLNRMDESAVLERDGDADESVNKVDVSDLTEFEISKAYSGYLDEDKDQ